MNWLLRTPYLRTGLTLALLAGFYGLPWLQWNGRQALLLDLVQRRFNLFGLTLWPDDVGLLLGLLALSAVLLALFTHLAGRLWCGHACPQTLWSQLFGWVERGTRWALHGASGEPLLRHAIWACLALATGLTVVGLFTPFHPLLMRAVQCRLGAWETFWIVFYAAATWGNAGFLRRHVCRALCPFARIQPLLADAHTPRMLYLAPRGEPRGARDARLGSVAARGRGLLDPTTAQDYVFRAAHPELAGPMPLFAADRLGDCIDCRLCVSACPVGLDVREGPQADCLACGACLVACNKVQHATMGTSGLIRYTRPDHGLSPPRRMLRPVTLVLLVPLCVLGAWRVARLFSG